MDNYREVCAGMKEASHLSCGGAEPDHELAPDHVESLQGRENVHS